MNILITICARKGSKRLKNKNIKDFCGKPLMEWTLLSALDFEKQIGQNRVDIVISTDIEKLNFINKYKDIYIYDRPNHLCHDDVNKLEVLSDVMNHMINLNSVRYDYLIDLDVTAPLRKKYDIYNALEKISYNNTNSKNLFSVVKARRIPWFNQVIIYDNNKVGYSSDFNFFKYPTGVFDMNASIYIYAAEFFSYPFSSPILENSILYEMEEWTAFDIDTQTDFEIAEMFFKKYILDYKNE